MEGCVYKYTGPAAEVVRDIEKTLYRLVKEQGRMENEAVKERGGLDERFTLS